MFCTKLNKQHMNHHQKDSRPIEFYRTIIRNIIDADLVNQDRGEFVNSKGYHFTTVTFCGQIHVMEFIIKDNKWKLEIEDGTSIIACYLPKVYKDSKDSLAAESSKKVDQMKRVAQNQKEALMKRLVKQKEDQINKLAEKEEQVQKEDQMQKEDQLKKEVEKHPDIIKAQNALWLAEKIKVKEKNAAQEFRIGMYMEINGAVKQSRQGNKRYINVLGYNFVDHDYAFFWKTRFS